MRMYGRVGPGQQQQLPQQHKNHELPMSAATAAARANSDKLENPYYYYGSTRNQKKVSQSVRTSNTQGLDTRIES